MISAVDIYRRQEIGKWLYAMVLLFTIAVLPSYAYSITAFQQKPQTEISCLIGQKPVRNSVAYFISQATISTGCSAKDFQYYKAAIIYYDGCIVAKLTGLRKKYIPSTHVSVFFRAKEMSRSTDEVSFL